MSPVSFICDICIMPVLNVDPVAGNQIFIALTESDRHLISSLDKHAYLFCINVHGQAALTLEVQIRTAAREKYCVTDRKHIRKQIGVFIAAKLRKTQPGEDIATDELADKMSLNFPMNKELRDGIIPCNCRSLQACPLTFNL